MSLSLTPTLDTVMDAVADDDPRLGTGNQIRFHEESEGSGHFTVTISFPEGDPVSASGVPLHEAMAASFGAQGRGFVGSIDEASGDLILSEPPEAAEAA